MFGNTAMQPNVDASRLFEPDRLAPYQYETVNKRTLLPRPELRLMAAVLEDAVATLTTDQRRCSNRQRREHKETLRWINAKDQSDWVFSFASVCEALGLDPDYLRGGLVRRVIANERNERIAPKMRGRSFSPRRKLVRLSAG